MGKAIYPDADIIAKVYEAAFEGDCWPATLQMIADAVGARGAVFMASHPSGMQAVASTRVADLLEDFFRADLHINNRAVEPLFMEMHPGFRTKTDYWSEADLADMPVAAEFFRPRGLVGGAATILQGVGDYLLHFTLDGFPTHQAASAAVPYLDALRPHLGRAFSLSALIASRPAQAMIDGLSMVGVPAAVIDAELRTCAVNDLFTARLDRHVCQYFPVMRFSTQSVQGQFLAAAQRRGDDRACSLAIRGAGAPSAQHLQPLRGRARECCGRDGTLMIVAEGRNRSIPESDLLRLLFDLTAAQAKLARLLLEGHTIAEAAAISRVSAQTAKVHLRAIYAKTGVGRQVDLVQLLSSFAVPAAEQPPKN